MSDRSLKAVNFQVDRILVAQAMDRGATLITKDEKIRNYSRVESFWSG